MESLINNLIRLDRDAVSRVEEVKQNRAHVVEDLEKTKQEFRKESKKAFEETLEKEKIKQKNIIKEKESRIEKKSDEAAAEFEAVYNEKCDIWVDSIVRKVLEKD